MRPHRPPTRLAALAVAALTSLAVLTLAAGQAEATTTPIRPAASSVGGSITRAEVITRARYWYDRRGSIPYDMGGSYPDQSGRNYRTDCTGYVSMAWHAGRSYANDIPTAAVAINKDALQAGDMLFTPSVGNFIGHAILFEKWADSGHTKYWAYQFGATPITHSVVTYADTDEGHVYKPYRYKMIVGDTCTGTAAIYGVLPDGRLTYSEISAVTGHRTKVLVGPNLGLGSVRALAALNFNTLLAETTAGALYRIDVGTNRTSLTVDGKPRLAASGWTLDKLAYDGHGRLFGTADGILRRYPVTAGTHTVTIGTGESIDSGFTLRTLTTTSAGHLLATTSDGRLLAYTVSGVHSWKSVELRSSTWQAMSGLTSPGGGVFYGHNGGALFAYRLNAAGTDVSGGNAVDTSGWSQSLLSADPVTVSCTA